MVMEALKLSAAEPTIPNGLSSLACLLSLRVLAVQTKAPLSHQEALVMFQATGNKFGMALRDASLLAGKQLTR